MTSPVPNIQQIVFVCVQHLLDTTLDLFKALIALGVIPDNIFLIGKQYSTSEDVAKQIQNLGIQLQKSTPLKILGEYTATFNYDMVSMWQRVEAHAYQHSPHAIIVLDDGGRCLECIMPGMLNELPIIGIEQTTAGLFNPRVINLHVPFIDVATCSAKIHLESNLIAETVLDKLGTALPVEKKGLACGVVGIGVIGTPVAKKLVSLGCKVYICDQNKKHYHKINSAHGCDSLEELIQQSDYIFGCTGQDITSQIDLNKLITQDKVLISCSSEDKEFLTLLKRIQTENNHVKSFNPLQNIIWKLSNGAVIQVLRGGFPITFDDSGIGASANKIQLTSGLLLSALIQAVMYISGSTDAKIKGRTMLHPQGQKFVAKEWFKANPEYQIPQQMINHFKDINWIAQNSGGVFCESAFIEQCFAEQLSEKTNYEIIN